MNWPQIAIDIAVTCLVISLGGYVIHWRAWFFSALGFAWVTLYLVGRAMTTGRIPLASPDVSFVFLSWVILLMNWVVARNQSDSHFLRIGVLVLACFFLGQAQWFTQPDPHYFELLKSPWFVIHSISQLTGFGTLAIAGIAGISSLFKHTLSLLCHKMIAVAFLLLTVGNMTGIIWSYEVTGLDWGLDSKQVFSLLAWGALGSYLYLTWQGKFSQDKADWVSILGFVCVMVSLLQ